MSCCVKSCRNNKKNSKFEFYSFPVAWWKLEQRRRWIAAVNRKNADGSPWQPKYSDLICSAHFMGGKKSEEEASPSYSPTLLLSDVRNVKTAMSTSSRLKRRKHTLTLKDKNEIIKRIETGDSYVKLSTEYGIGRSTIYDIFKNRKDIEKAANLPYKSNRKTLRAAENPVLEDKLYEWFMAERHLYPMSGSLMMVKARTIHKELTGNDDFMASSGWLDRFKKRRGIVLGSRGLGSVSSESSGSQVSTSEAATVDPLPDSTPQLKPIKVEKTSSGDQVIIRVTDKLDAKTNVLNRFSVRDGHFENNVIVKEEEVEVQQEMDESSENMETEGDRQEFQEEMFPAAEAILGDSNHPGERDSLLHELNKTLSKFVAEYSERTQLMRERLELERARLQFDMQVFQAQQEKNS